MTVGIDEPFTPEQIEENWNRFRSLCLKVDDDRGEPLMKMVDTIAECLAMSPASSKVSFHRAQEGGLVEHSLRVLMNAKSFAKAQGWDIPRNSLIIAALFHDIGKAGTWDGTTMHRHYVPQKSDWHFKQGNTYTTNEEVPFMTVRDRSVFLMQQFGVRLERDEYLAILLNDGWVQQDNRPYCLKVPPLVIAIQTADYISTCAEKADPNGF